MTERLSWVLGADHAGFALKEHLRAWLVEHGHTVDDRGPHAPERVDYPDFAHPVAAAVASGEAERGLLVCGTGIGMAIAANRHPGVRAAAVTTEFEARATRAHNDANVLCLGERVVGVGVAEGLLAAFCETAFEGGRHTARVAKLDRP